MDSPTFEGAVSVAFLEGLGEVWSLCFFSVSYTHLDVYKRQGLIAKENVVSTFGILYDGDAGWYANVQAAFTYASGYAFLAFNLLCAPCFAAMGAIKREMNNTKWFFAAIGYQCGIAWVVSLWIYQFAGLAVGEVSFNVFTVLAIATFIAFLWLLFRPNKWQGKAAVRAVDEA